LILIFNLFQALVGRIQKEKDTLQAEFIKLQERSEGIQAQLGKVLRDKDATVAEVEVLRDRADKATQMLQKLQAK